MTFFQNLLTVMTVLNLIFAGTVIFLERRNVAATWAWLMVLVFLPSVGFILYLILGQNLSRRKLYKIKGDRFDTIRGVIYRQFQELEQGIVKYKDPSISGYHDMIHMNLVSSFALFTQDNEVEIFKDGKSKFEALFHAIDAAEHHIHLLYFIVRNDDLGNRLVQALTEKAKAGVEVRFLYDDIGCSSLPQRFFHNLREAGGEAVAFFPSRIRYLNFRVNYRNHRKLAIIDGKYGFIGGFNIGDEYLGLMERFGEWRDTHLMIKGGAVLQIQSQFMLDWNLATRKEMQIEPQYYPVPIGRGTVGMQIVASGPDSEEQQIKNGYIKMINSAKESIYLQTPYFIPDESLLTALKLAALSGVDVKIMIPSMPDHKLVYWASSSYLGELLNCGVKCYLYGKGFLHAKTMVVDGKIASVGTANIDIRSFKLNFEVNAFIYDTRTASKLMYLFEKDKESSTELTIEFYRNRSLMIKLKESCSRLLSPIL
ncbi:cardiolipin synthase [Paenibacillus eucommiae]|uniref:Cardiolipin synthase n=1 Tax=Paenibacillus eucommiae TaxID=1355755 RepID=A0ABS4ISD0_9BACL|nr:cardiolipin synthase [Paenibacillus eucommiae]MBP1990477.1 cardiolipin synthase [Paenibacillus eucommiae]